MWKLIFAIIKLVAKLFNIFKVSEVKVQRGKWFIILNTETKLNIYTWNRGRRKRRDYIESPSKCTNPSCWVISKYYEYHGTQLETYKFIHLTERFRYKTNDIIYIIMYSTSIKDATQTGGSSCSSAIMIRKKRNILLSMSWPRLCRILV